MTALIYLLRHGASLWNRDKRITGQCDPPLAEEGHSQARNLAIALAEESLGAIFASHLTRSVATAAPLAELRGLAINQEAALNERHFGALEGRYRDPRDPEAAALWGALAQASADTAPPGGESFNTLLARVREAADRVFVAARHAPVVVVGHRHTNRALLCHWLGWSFEQARGAGMRHHFVYRLELGGTRRVQTISLRPREVGRMRTGLWL